MMKKLGINDILETDRCIIKIPQKSDAKYMWSLISDNTTKYMIWNKGDTHETTLKNILESQENSKIFKTWDAAIYIKNSENCIGRCGINRINESIPLFELGYWIPENYYGKGIMPECVNRYLKFAFEESNFEKGVIRCDSKNINSQKVALKCGFEFEGEFKNHERINGELRDTKFFGITRDQYLKKNNPCKT